jgi:phosphopantetheinyl transferase
MQIVACRVPDRAPSWVDAAVGSRPAARAAQLSRRRDPLDRLRAVVGDLLAEHLLGEDGSLTAPGRPGRPTATVPRRHLSVAHSPGWVVVAAARAPLGVDVECLTPAAGRCAAAALSARERAQVAALAPERRLQWCVSAWTAREAVLKRRGVGLAYPPQQLRVALRDGARHALVVAPDGRLDRVDLVVLDPAAVVAVSGGGPAPGIARVALTDVESLAGPAARRPAPPCLPTVPAARPRAGRRWPARPHTEENRCPS